MDDEGYLRCKGNMRGKYLETHRKSSVAFWVSHLKKSLVVFGSLFFCLDPWFLGFLVSQFLGFKVYWFQSSKLSTIILQVSISCFLEDIDFIFKISKKLEDVSSSFSVPACPKHIVGILPSF